MLFRSVFEPELRNFVALTRNCQYENVYFFRAALGKKEDRWGHINKTNQETNTGMHKVIGKEDGHIPIMTIDELNLPRCDLIQLDIEGGEPNAIRGAEQTIAKWKPVVITEGNHGEVRSLLEKYDYIEAGVSHADFIYRPKE